MFYSKHIPETKNVVFRYLILFLITKCQACGKSFETAKGLSIHIGKNKDDVHSKMKKNGPIKKDEFKNLTNEIEHLKNEIKSKIRKLLIYCGPIVRKVYLVLNQKYVSIQGSDENGRNENTSFHLSRLFL